MLVPIVACFLAIVHTVLALPFWQSAISINRHDPLVPGASHLEALPLRRRTNPKAPPMFIAVNAERGTPGSAVIRQEDSPPIFFVHQDQLWQYHNQSYIFPVNLVNSTLTAPLPLQLVSGSKNAGVSGGSWYWKGTMLYYQFGQKSNLGVYYACRDTDGKEGVFTSLDPTIDPVSCDKVILRSLDRLSSVQ